MHAFIRVGTYGDGHPYGVEVTDDGARINIQRADPNECRAAARALLEAAAILEVGQGIVNRGAE